MAPRLTDQSDCTTEKGQGIYRKGVIFHKGAYAMIRARGNGRSSVWRFSILRGKENPLLPIHTQRKNLPV